MAKITKNSRVVVADDVVSCDLDGEAAILNLKDGVYYGLDPVGAKIWNSLQQTCRVDDLIEMVLEEYEVDKKRCENDILDLINELIDNGLVKVNA
jgi:hypothetical protein